MSESPRAEIIIPEGYDWADLYETQTDASDTNSDACVGNDFCRGADNE